MNYLREKYENGDPRKSVKETAFSPYEGEKTFCFSNELLAIVFLWRADRSKVRENAKFQF